MSAPDDQTLIDRYLDAMWLQRGLARNTLAAYRRDLERLSAWLGDRPLAEARAEDLFAMLGERHAAGYSARSTARRSPRPIGCVRATCSVPWATASASGWTRMRGWHGWQRGWSAGNRSVPR